MLTDVDAWLRDGGVVVAASERAARALASSFHKARRAEGLAAWPSPQILDWSRFVRTSWESYAADARLLLNTAQERQLWAQLIAAHSPLAAALEGNRYRLADMAMEAHSLLCRYAPQFLQARARIGWDQDAAAFSVWLAEFDDVCRQDQLISSARLAYQLADQLASSTSSRPPLLLVGFDRILPAQRALLEAWGRWRSAAAGNPAWQVCYYDAPGQQAELEACARWCSQQLAANPQARLLVLTQEVPTRRGEMERIFRLHLSTLPSAPGLEFSLGVPLSRTALGRSAYLALKWLASPLQEHELDWLLSTAYLVADAQEAEALTTYMRRLRHRGLERNRWSLSAFFEPSRGVGTSLPVAWRERMDSARLRLRSSASAQSPLDWVELLTHLLQLLGWPGSRSLSSAEFQAYNRWQQALDAAGSLAFDGSSLTYTAFLDALDRILSETLFASESGDPSILIAGAAEAAGLVADGIWFLGASEGQWPQGGTAHPMLPIGIQRQFAMPHAHPQLDWELAHAITQRLLISAPEVHFSYARLAGDVEERPSRLIVQMAGVPQSLPPAYTASPLPAPRTQLVQDTSQIPFPPGQALGGSSLLTYQSQCPFKAFVTERLDATRWQPAQSGLSASQRGRLLHEVLHAVWGGPPKGIRSHAELMALSDLPSFVARIVGSVLDEKMPRAALELMPAEYLELERERLTRLITEWLEYEAARVPFMVEKVESDTQISIAGLQLKLRLDRIDRLVDQTVLVVDYKTGDVSPKAWQLPRADDVQLPLYAGFALDREAEPLGGLTFAKVRAGETEFAGRLFAPQTTLFADARNGKKWMKTQLTLEELDAWRRSIEQLAGDFLAGRSNVDPRDPIKTCEQCGLQTVCRIQAAAQDAVDEIEDDENSEEDYDA